MQAQLVAWIRARPLWVRATVGVLAALALVYLLPLVLVPEAGLDDAEKRLNAENDLRTTLVQAIGGAVLLFGTWRTLHINREGQITDRFTRAIDQLGQTGQDKLDVRLGGIYALERIARNSEFDRGPIIEVLTAFLREHARWNPDYSDTPSVTDCGEAGTGNEHRPRLRADFQAVATVLGRNHWSKQHHFDLRDVDLRYANLAGAHLEGADLSRAHLEGAWLKDAHLNGADLVGAHLVGARLYGAHLERAYLLDAHLEWARLTGAHLEAANLRSAHLERADLRGAHYLAGANMERASLRGANLEGADLLGVHLQSADLAGAHLEGANLRGAHLEGAILRSAHLQRAFLVGAHLRRADLRSAHLEAANLNGAHLESVGGLETAHLDGVIGLDSPWKPPTSSHEDKHTARSETPPAELDDEVD